MLRRGFGCFLRLHLGPSAMIRSLVSKCSSHLLPRPPPSLPPLPPGPGLRHWVVLLLHHLPTPSARPEPCCHGRRALYGSAFERRRGKSCTRRYRERWRRPGGLGTPEPRAGGSAGGPSRGGAGLGVSLVAGVGGRRCRWSPAPGAAQEDPPGSVPQRCAEGPARRPPRCQVRPPAAAPRYGGAEAARPGSPAPRGCLGAGPRSRPAGFAPGGARSSANAPGAHRDRPLLFTAGPQ